jgi:hypothetical protein
VVQELMSQAVGDEVAARLEVLGQVMAIGA